MVKNITRRLSLTTTSAIAVAMILVGQVAALAVPCLKPKDIDTVLCATVANTVSGCAALNSNVANGCGYTVAAIQNFPNGTMDSATGSTKQELSNCYTTHS